VRLLIGSATLCFALCGGVSDTYGQAPDSARDCFRGHPLPECRTFWITEIGYYRTTFGSDLPSAPLSSGAALNSHTAWDIGLMRNRTPTRADGYVAEIGFNEGGVRIGGSRRYRFWLPSQQSLDISLGVVHLGVRPVPNRHVPGNGLTADVSYGWHDLAAATVRADVVRSEGHTFGAVYTGVKLGSFPALLATAAGALYIGLLIIALGGEGT
jgi:hypothetical protein